MAASLRSQAASGGVPPTAAHHASTHSLSVLHFANEGDSSLPFFKMVPNNLDLRRVFHPLHRCNESKSRCLSKRFSLAVCLNYCGAPYVTGPADAYSPYLLS